VIGREEGQGVRGRGEEEESVGENERVRDGGRDGDDREGMCNEEEGLKKVSISSSKLPHPLLFRTTPIILNDVLFLHLSDRPRLCCFLCTSLP
jgi:hypothetical protein